MKPALLSLSLLFPLLVLSQTDLPAVQPLRIEATEDSNMKEDNSQGLSPNLPSLFNTPSPVNTRDSLMVRNVKMLPEKELRQAGYNLKIDPKVTPKEQNNNDKHYGDMYLGDLKTSAKYVGIVCRDHEYVDGDRVRIYANDVVVEPNILLNSSFKGINLNLDKGFNRLDFEALNQGSSGPNTAQVNVYDEAGKLLYSKQWLLSTGSKASLIIVQEDE